MVPLVESLLLSLDIIWEDTWGLQLILIYQVWAQLDKLCFCFLTLRVALPHLPSCYSILQNHHISPRFLFTLAREYAGW